MLGNLNKDQIENILHSQSICRIACCDDKLPYLVPITYYYDGKYIYGQSQEGMKINILRKNPNVCIQVDLITSMSIYQSVIVNGKFEELKPGLSEKARSELHENILTMMTRSRIHKFEHSLDTEFATNSPDKLIMFRIKINEVTGRFENQEIAINTTSSAEMK